MAEEKASTIELNEEITALNNDNETVDAIATTVIETTTIVTDGDGQTTETVVVTHEQVIDPCDKDPPEVADDESARAATDENTKEDENDEEDPDNASKTKTKKAKPLSPSMQRLTASKRSPDLAKKNGPSSDERKAKAQLIRKSKISEHRNKEDDKRAAVLERKRKLEELERAKKEALLKKITVDTAPKNKQASMKRYSSSTSNLTQLKKNKAVEKQVDIDIDDNDATTKRKPADRPASSLARTRPASSSSNLAVKTSSSTEKKTSDIKRPMTAEPKKPTTSKAPNSRLSLNPRPASTLGIAGTDRRKTVPGRPGPVKPTTTATKTRPKPVITTTTVTKTVKKTEPEKKSSTTKAEVTKKDATKKTPDNTAKKPLKKPLDKPTTKETKKPIEAKRPSSATKKDPAAKGATKKPPVSKSETKTKKPGDSKAVAESSSNKLTEEEAKKALQERRKKAKEEAEAKAKAEREKDELERQRREEEEKRLAEQLKEEEQRQSALLEQLKVEEEERRQKMIEEKEQREREEKERLEAEAKQRDDEIERKAKIEAEKIQKEQQKKDQESEAARIERKKRVESIMARVSANRTGSTDTPVKSQEEPAITSPSEDGALSPPLTEATRQKVDGILKSKGLTKSFEDLLSATANEEETKENANAFEPDEQRTQLDDVNPTADTPAASESLNADNPIAFDDPAKVPSEIVNIPTSQVDVQVTNETEEPKLVVGDTLLLDVESATTPQVDEVVTVSQSPVDTPSAVIISVTDDDLKAENSSVDLVLNDNNNLNKTPISAWNATENLDSGADDTPKNSCVFESDEITEDHHKDDILQPDEVSSEIVDTYKTSEDKTGVLLTNGTPTVEISQEDLSNTTETQQWVDFEARIKQLNDNATTTTNAVISNEESKLWKVAEGKVELSECF